MTDDLLERYKNSSQPEKVKNVHLQAQIEEIHSWKEEYESGEEIPREEGSEERNVSSLMNNFIGSKEMDCDVGLNATIDRPELKKPSSASPFWEDPGNKNSTEIANDFCVSNGIENHLNSTNLVKGNCSEPNFQASLEIMSKLELENIRLNEKLERLKLKEETSSFLNLTESQKLRHDISRVEEINFRLRKILAERITRERELQEKVEQLENDLEANCKMDKNKEYAREEDLKYYRMMEYFRNNICSVVQHEEEQRKQLENKIDIFLTNLNEIKKYEIELVEKLRQDDLIIKELLQKIIGLNQDIDQTTLNNSCVKKSNNGDEKHQAKERDSLGRGNGKTIRGLKSLTEESEVAVTNPKWSWRISLEKSLPNSCRSQSGITNNINESTVLPESFEINENEQKDTTLKPVTHQKFTNFQEDRIPNLSSEFKAPKKEEDHFIHMNRSSGTNLAFLSEVSVKDQKQMGAETKEDCQVCEKKKSTNFAINGCKKILRDGSQNKCCSDKLTLGFNLSKRNKPLQESTELYADNKSDLSKIVLCPSKSDLNTQNVVGNTEKELGGVKINTNGFTGNLEESYIKKEKQERKGTSLDPRSFVTRKIKKYTHKTDENEIEMASQTDQFYETKLDSLEKNILELGEQLKTFETKITAREHENSDQSCKTDLSDKKKCDSAKSYQNHTKTSEQEDSERLQIYCNEQKNVELDNLSNKKSMLEIDPRRSEVKSSHDKFHSAENCSSGEGNYDDFLADLKKNTRQSAQTERKLKAHGSQKLSEQKLKPKSPSTQICPCQDAIEAKAEITFYSASIPGLMKVKFSDKQSNDRSIIENSISHCNKTTKIKDKKQLDLVCTEETEHSSDVNKKKINIEKYLIRLGKKCYFIESLLKIQKKQFEFLQTHLKKQNSTHIKEITKIPKKDIVSFSNRNVSRDSKDLRKTPKPQQGNECAVSNQSDKKSYRKDIKAYSGPDFKYNPTSEKYLSKLCSYMQNMETCLKIQEQIQADLLNAVQSSSLIKKNVVSTESIRAIFSPSAALIESPSIFNEHMSHTPSEDDYFLVKACRSREKLIDSKHMLSNTLEHDIISDELDEQKKSKIVKPEFEQTNRKKCYDSSGETFCFPMIETFCRNLEQQLKVIEANLKYQDAIHDFLLTCLEKNDQQIDFRGQNLFPETKQKETNRTKSLDRKVRRKRKLSKICGEKKFSSMENVRCSSINISGIPFIETSQTGSQEELDKKQDKIQLENQLLASTYDNTKIETDSESLIYRSETPTKLRCIKTLSKKSSEPKNQKPFDIQSPHKKLKDRPSKISNRTTEISKYKEGKTSPDFIHKMIERIEKNTVLLEKRMNCISTNVEDKDEIFRCLKKLLKEKKLVSQRIKENAENGNHEETREE